jgi:hypothetical protein
MVAPLRLGANRSLLISLIAFRLALHLKIV